MIIVSYEMNGKKFDFLQFHFPVIARRYIDTLRKRGAINILVRDENDEIIELSPLNIPKDGKSSAYKD